MTHPLDPLTAEELETAIATLRREQALGDSYRFAVVELREPPNGPRTGR